MKKSSNHLEVKLKLPKNYRQKVLQAMNNEFKVSCKKWSIELDSATKKKIIENSLQQLKNKIASISGNKWELEDEELLIHVSSRSPDTLVLPDKTVKGFSFVRTHDEWKLDQDPNPDAIPVEDFYKFVLSEIDQWARTAVFYGVGSYNRV